MSDVLPTLQWNINRKKAIRHVNLAKNSVSRYIIYLLFSYSKRRDLFAPELQDCWQDGYVKSLHSLLKLWLLCSNYYHVWNVPDVGRLFCIQRYTQTYDIGFVLRLTQPYVHILIILTDYMYMLTKGHTSDIDMYIYDIGHGHKEKIRFYLMSLCLCHYVPTMLLCCVVYTGDIKHKSEVFFCICLALLLCRYVPRLCEPSLIVHFDCCVTWVSTTFEGSYIVVQMSVWKSPSLVSLK